MSGPENIKGFDYQISYSLLKTLELLANDSSDMSIIFESLDEQEEDFNIISENFDEYHQLKKRNEGNHWTPGDLKLILNKFIDKDKGSTKFCFVTDGTANPDLKKLKKLTIKDSAIDDVFLSLFLPEDKTIAQLKDVLRRTSIYTRFFSSDDDDDPAKNLKKEIFETLNNPPFELQYPASACFSELWKLVFDYAREAKRISIQNIKNDFVKKGVSIVQKPWLEIPLITGFLGREEELNIILTNTTKSNIIIIYGINGIGKTWMVSKIVEENALNTTCWINTNRWTSIDHFIFLFSAFLYSNGHVFEAKKLHDLDIAKRLPTITKILEILDVTIVVDSVNSGNKDFFEFIVELIKHLKIKKLLGKLIISSTNIVQGYSEIDVIQKRIYDFNLKGFSIEDTKLILSTLIKTIDEESIIAFHNALGGHPMAIFFLKELLDKNYITQIDISDIRTKSIEVARDWIIEKSISNLSETNRDYLLKLSLLEGYITEEEISFILDSGIKSKYLLNELYIQHLISFQDGNLLIHDSIKEVAINMLGHVYKFTLHKKLVDFYFSIMDSQYSAKESVLYEWIMKWGHQTEQLKGSNLLDDKYALIINQSDEELAALWAIRRFGYPFDFKTEDLSSSELIVKILLGKALITKNLDPHRTYMDSPVEYILLNIDFWQECFITYLCLSRNLSNHLGYISVFLPNFSFHVQNITCWWEHCIEYMPLPSIPKSEEIEHSNFIKEQFEKGAYDSKTTEEIEFLRSMLIVGEQDEENNDIDEENELESQASWCPIFGHCCPGGEEQSIECRNDTEEDEPKAKE